MAEAQTIEQRVPATQQLPSIKNYLTDPKVLKTGLIISVVLNFLMLIAVVSSLGSGNNDDLPRPTPFTKPSSTATPTTKPSPSPTNTPDQFISELEKCFNECLDNQLVTRLQQESEKVSYFKATIEINNQSAKTCYGRFLEASAPNLERNSYFYTDLCPNINNFNAPQDNIRIADNIYYRTGRIWDEGTTTPLGQTKLSQVINELAKQQSFTSESSMQNNTKVKTIIGTSSIVNEFNQLITKTISLTVDDKLQVLNYEINEENTYLEQGGFFDYNAENSINSPV